MRRRWARRVGKDAEAGKLTFPAVLGVEARASGGPSGLIREACRNCTLSATLAGCLESLASYVLERNR